MADNCRMRLVEDDPLLHVDQVTETAAFEIQQSLAYQLNSASLGDSPGGLCPVTLWCNVTLSQAPTLPSICRELLANCL